MTGLPLESHHLPDSGGIREDILGGVVGAGGPSKPLWTKPGGASTREDLCVVLGLCKALPLHRKR